MISIVICSYKKHFLEKLTASIQETIDTPFEIITIDNSQNQFGICKAYNTGAMKAKYDILCFMHEDTTIETVGWGHKVIAHLSNPAIGMIGIAGGDTKSMVPSSWSSFIFVSEINLMQHFRLDSKPPQRFLRTAYPEDNSPLKPVACIDGVWMCTRRDVFAKCKFDDTTFPGFHGYDIDFSLQVSTEYRIGVVFDILIHHYSEGTFDKNWMDNTIKVSDKWKKTLPRSVRDLPKQEFLRQHWTVMRIFLTNLVLLDYKLPVILSLFFRYSFNRYFHWKHFLHFIKFILIKKFSKKNAATGVLQVK